MAKIISRVTIFCPSLCFIAQHCFVPQWLPMVKCGEIIWKLSMLMVNSRKDCQKMSIDTVCSSLLLDHFPTSFPGFSLVFHCVFLISSEATSNSSRRFSPGNSPGPAALPSNRISTTWSALLRSEKGQATTATRLFLDGDTTHHWNQHNQWSIQLQ